MKKTEEYEFNGFKYKANVNTEKEDDLILEVIHNQEKPEHLYKYYSFNKNSIDALVNGYFFASHPYQLNDAMDSSMFLLAARSLTIEYYYRFFNTIYTKEEIKEIYNKDKIDRFHYLILQIWSVSSNIYGVISLAAEGYSPLMWPHYTAEKGFQIKFSSKKLHESLKEKIEVTDGEIVSFAPINYCSKLKPIDISKFDYMHVPFLYSTSIKNINWQYESEWRFIVSRGQMGVPNSSRGLNDIADHITNIENRKAYYNKNLVEEIVLGHDFLNAKDFNLEINHETQEYILKMKNRKDGMDFTTNALSFLNYLFKNLKDKIYLSGTKYESDDNNESLYLVRTKERMEIEKTNARTFKFLRTNEFSVLG